MALEGNFYLKKNLAPPGTKVIIHKKPGQKNPWDPHGVYGRYLGPEIEHYRFHTLYVNTYQAERIADKYELFTEHNKITGTYNQ